jgi:hypothetical protein
MGSNYEKRFDRQSGRLQNPRANDRNSSSMGRFDIFVVNERRKIAVSQP